MGVNWEEGNYRVTDTPRPRGEILIGGASVARGYFKNEEKTAEDFYNEGGKRWFRTGDIAEMFEDGTVRIVDRKKDLVKLQMGEYVSLGKVESVIKISPLVESVCIVAQSDQTFAAAIVVPDKDNLSKLCKEI